MPETPEAEPSDAASSPSDPAEQSLFVLRDADGSALSALETVTTFPHNFAAVVGDNLSTLIGEQPITLGSWNQAEHADRPSILGFDQAGSLMAVVLSDGSDDTEGRVERTVEWLQTLTLRDVLKMHASVEALMDTLLEANPDELHLTLGPDRRVVLLQLASGLNQHKTFPGVSKVVGVELFSGLSDGLVLRRASGADSVLVAEPSNEVVVEPVAAEGVIDLTEGAVEADTVGAVADGTTVGAGVVGAGVVGAAVVGAGVTGVSADRSGVVDTSEGDTPKSDTPESDTTSSEATESNTLVGDQPVESSLAPPPLVRNTADEAAIEPGAVSFKPGTPMRSADLNAYLADKTGQPDDVAPGCVQSGKHVLLTEVLSGNQVLENRGHYHRVIDEAVIDRFREWYDGSIPKVTFHLLVQSEDNADETTYVGRLKPTAWEHRLGAQNLLFRIVPRIGSDLWVVLSSGNVPTVQPAAVTAEEPEPWPVVPAKEAEAPVRRRGVRRQR